MEPAPSDPMDLPDLRAVLPPSLLQQRLLAMLQWIDERLSCANVTYWITGGTLLGALRHQGGGGWSGLVGYPGDVDSLFWPFSVFWDEICGWC